MDITSKALFRIGAPGILAPILLLLIVVCLLFYSQYRQWAKYSKIPGPRPAPFVGNLLDITPFDIDLLAIVSNLAKQFNSIFMVWVGSKPLVIISEPDHLRVFYTNATMIDRGSVAYHDLDEVLGKDSLFLSGGDTWKKLRKMMIKTFHPTPNSTFLKNFLKCHKGLAESFREKADGSMFPCTKMVKHMFLESILLSLTGHQFAREVTWRILDAGDHIMHTSYTRQVSFFLRNDWIFQCVPAGRRFKKESRNIHKLVSILTDEKHVQMQRMVENGEDIPNLYIFNMFRKYGHESMDLIKLELLNLILTGMDTTANTICFTLLICGLYPEIQERIYQEDQEVMKSLAGKDLEFADLEKFEFLDRVIKEILRFFPVAPIIGRTLGEDTQFGKYLVPKGTDVYAATFLTSLNPEFFPDPLKFDPDRFLPENAKKIPPYAYAPFSAGFRGCPGNRYAIIGVKAVLTALLRDFVIKSHYGSLEELMSNTHAELTMNDKQGYPIRVLPRRSC